MVQFAKIVDYQLIFHFSLFNSLFNEAPPWPGTGGPRAKLAGYTVL